MVSEKNAAPLSRKEQHFFYSLQVIACFPNCSQPAKHSCFKCFPILLESGSSYSPPWIQVDLLIKKP